MPGFRLTVTAYFDALAALGMRLLRLLALSLGLPPDYFAPHFTHPMVALRPLHYTAEVKWCIPCFACIRLHRSSSAVGTWQAVRAKASPATVGCVFAAVMVVAHSEWLCSCVCASCALSDSIQSCGEEGFLFT